MTYRTTYSLALLLAFVPACGSDSGDAKEEDRPLQSGDPGGSDDEATKGDGTGAASNNSSSSEGYSTTVLDARGDNYDAATSNGTASPNGSTSSGAMIDGGEAGADGLAYSEPGSDSDGVDDQAEPDPDPQQVQLPPATNPFVVTNHDPLSTFAADVDTASYDIFRQWLDAGSLPPADQVRLEEFVNYFSYDYPAPAHDSDVPFSINLAAAASIMERDTVMLRVGIQGRDAPPEAQKETNLVFLIDVSGSMAGPEKLPLIQYTLLEALDVLQPTDKISIVTYAGSTAVRLEPTAVSERAEIETVINELASGGSTAGASGLTLAYEQAEAGYVEGGINHIVLCTDGDFNVGISADDDLVELVRQHRDEGTTMTVLGFGMNNDSMMEAISNAGNGVYGVITDEDQASRYVHERMVSTLVHIAKDMKLQVEFNPDEVYAYRLLGYENRAIADELFRDDTVDAGEVGAGHRVTALYELVLNADDLPDLEGAPAPQDGDAYAGEVEVDPSDLVLVKVRYKDVDATDDDAAMEVAASLDPKEVAATYDDLDADFQWAASIATFAEILKSSPYADANDLPRIGKLVKLDVHASDPDRQEFTVLFDQAVTLLEGDPE